MVCGSMLLPTGFPDGQVVTYLEKCYQAQGLSRRSVFPDSDCSDAHAAMDGATNQASCSIQLSQLGHAFWRESLLPPTFLALIRVVKTGSEFPAFACGSGPQWAQCTILDKMITYLNSEEENWYMVKLPTSELALW